MNIRLMSYRFLWVEFQIVEICYACVDGTADRIPGLPQRLPTKLQDNYRAAFQRVCDDEKFELARRVFQWVMYARRPMTLKGIGRCSLGINGPKVLEGALTKASSVGPKQDVSESSKLR
jgi:hypothetical protein